MRSLDDILEEYMFLDGDERYRLLIELGRELEAMPDALKTDATLVRGCSASVWVYPTQAAAEVAATDIAAALAPFDLKKQLSSNRTQGVPNMIALVREHAARIAAAD